MGSGSGLWLAAQAVVLAAALGIPSKPLLPFAMHNKPSRGLTTGDLKIAFLAPLRYMNKETGQCEAVCDEGLDLAEVPQLPIPSFPPFPPCWSERWC